MDQVTADELLRNAAWLRRLARGLARDEDLAEEAVQDTWLAAWRRPPALDRPVRPWLAEVLRNFLRSRGRAAATGKAAQRRLVAEPSAADHPAATPEGLLARHQTLRLVAELVSALDEPYRATLLLCHYEGLTPQEIAAREGIPAGTVRWRLKEARDELRRRLDERCPGGRQSWAVALAPLARGIPDGLTKGALIVKCLEKWAQADPSLHAGVMLAITLDERGLEEVWIEDHAEVPREPLTCISQAVYEEDWGGLTKEPLQLTRRIRYEQPDAGR